MRFRKTRPWFLYQKAPALTSGAAQFGFLGDGSLSNRIPYLATGSQGQVTQRQLGIMPASSGNVNVALPGTPFYQGIPMFGTDGLITDPSTIVAGSATISPGGNY